VISWAIFAAVSTSCSISRVISMISSNKVD
jgi:hypothetical protein